MFSTLIKTQLQPASSSPSTSPLKLSSLLHSPRSQARLREGGLVRYERFSVQTEIVYLGLKTFLRQ